MSSVSNCDQIALKSTSGIRVNPVVLSVRTCDIAIQAHRNCITKFSHARAPAEQSSPPRGGSLFHKCDNR